MIGIKPVASKEVISGHSVTKVLISLRIFVIRIQLASSRAPCSGLATLRVIFILANQFWIRIETIRTQTFLLHLPILPHMDRYLKVSFRCSSQSSYWADPKKYIKWNSNHTLPHISNYYIQSSSIYLIKSLSILVIRQSFMSSTSFIQLHKVNGFFINKTIQKQTRTSKSTISHQITF